ncbi:hypothetical protein EON62_01170, partial [archaeon]
VVVGDLVKLAPGDRLACDGVLVESFDVEVNQSSMTGESNLVRKDVAEDCYLIGGCIVQQGDGMFLCTAVGVSSKMGQTVALVENEEASNTPLQDQLENMAEEIGKVGTAAGALTFAVLTLLWLLAPEAATRNYMLLSTYTDVLRFFIVGVTIVVVAVPEGLPLAVTISLAFSMRRMMKDNNLVRELQACETMGSATVIASDKTGTLTENRMSVVQMWAFGKHLDAAHIDRAGEVLDDPGAVQRLAKAIVYNTTAALKITDARVEFVGNPTEGALLFMLWSGMNVDYSAMRHDNPRPLARRPFDKATKFMSTVMPADAKTHEASPIIYVKVRTTAAAAAAAAWVCTRAACICTRYAPRVCCTPHCRVLPSRCWRCAP